MTNISSDTSYASSNCRYPTYNVIRDDIFCIVIFIYVYIRSTGDEYIRW